MATGLALGWQPTTPFTQITRQASWYRIEQLCNRRVSTCSETLLIRQPVCCPDNALCTPLSFITTIHPLHPPARVVLTFTKIERIKIKKTFPFCLLPSLTDYGIVFFRVTELSEWRWMSAKWFYTKTFMIPRNTFSSFNSCLINALLTSNTSLVIRVPFN